MNFKLQNRWNIYTHSTIDNNWNNESYNKLFSLDNLFDLKIFNNSVNKPFFSNNMIFIMRDNIFPTWEDKSNKEGCTASYKINTNDFYNLFEKIFESIICENIHKDIDKYNEINGISIIPKKKFFIFKIWFKSNINNAENYINIIKPYIVNKNCRLKKHIN